MTHAYGEGLTIQQQPAAAPLSPERVSWEHQPAATVASIRAAIERKKAAENARDALREKAKRRKGDQ